LAKILIRGGDLDLVEYEFQPFVPGQCIKTLGLEKDYQLTPVSGKITVTAPGRIHLTVLDMNRFAPDRPGEEEWALPCRSTALPRWNASHPGWRSTILGNL
jgi:hypothetical protein